ncbi:hypothetical protein C3L33_19938, partial [Rhododendron williamsianum]
MGFLLNLAEFLNNVMLFCFDVYGTTLSGFMTNLSDVFREAIRTGQINSLYQGLGTKNLQSFISQFVYFYGYSYFKRLYLVKSGSKSIGTTANLVLAAAAGACTAIVTQPLDTASSKMQTSAFGKSKGLWLTLTEGSWSEAFDGLGISLLCKVMIQAADSNDNEASKVTRRSRKTVAWALCAIWKQEGVLGFFKGLHAQILKTVLSSALLLMIKEKITATTWVLILAMQRGSSKSQAVSDSPAHVAVNFTDTFSKPVSGSDEPQSSGWFQIFSLAYYKPYFDVDTSDVLERIKDSLIPFRGSFSEKTASNPDLYGPFWICTTLIFVAASIGTFVTYVAHKIHKKEWNYDINLVTWSAGLFYGYVAVVPLCLYIILKYFSAPSGLVQLFCLYGYSLFVFIPALCLSIIPLEIFRWVVTGVAGFMSATFVALNLRNHIQSAGERWFLIVAGIFLLQLALAVVLKLYLFTVTV